MPVDRDVIRKQLAATLDGTALDALGAKYEGKVRDNYVTTDGRRILVATDRLSAFDRVLTTIPFKGQVINQMAAYWFAERRPPAWRPTTSSRCRIRTSPWPASAGR